MKGGAVFCCRSRLDYRRLQAAPWRQSRHDASRGVRSVSPMQHQRAAYDDAPTTNESQRHESIVHL
jgi:hypothetical protein